MRKSVWRKIGQHLLASPNENSRRVGPPVAAGTVVRRGHRSHSQSGYGVTMRSTDMARHLHVERAARSSILGSS